MLTSIDLDETVVAQAMRLTGARCKHELVGQFRVEQPRASDTVAGEASPASRKSTARAGHRASATKTTGRKRTGT